ncbi:MAG TPA: DUF2165 domain-containing protein [Steroidobacteraceae bacterium]|nr:DUF2165 domain-containing protein [Steroidobacteraceae bacterium]
MRMIKTTLVAGLALVLSITTFNNIIMPGATYGAVALSLGMQTTFKNPQEMWRAITNPAALWVICALIIAGEALGALLCWIGAVRLFANRHSAPQFNQSKKMALIGATYVALFYFLGWLVVANEWFGMWQSTRINTMPDAFWLFAEGMLIAMWVNTPDV